MSSSARAQALIWVEPRYTSRATKQAFIRIEKDNNWWECSLPAECWLDALWEAGEGTRTVSPFAACSMAVIAGLTQSEPS